MFIELLLPFLIILPRRLRHLAASAFIALQIVIGVTGNYNFFNLLAIALCVFLFDDQALSKLLPRRVFTALAARPAAAERGPRAWAITAVCAVLVVCGGSLTFARATEQPLSPRIVPLFEVVQDFRLVGGYGPFAVMTKQRDEIVIEGSADGATWLAYELPYKPQALGRRPMQVAPHQPRVDWQLWFAALSDYRQQPWFIALVRRLLEGSDEVEALFAVNPFPDQPPAAIRARLYRYRFTTPDERTMSGNWWAGHSRGLYLPEVRLTVRASGARGDDQGTAPSN
jgi:hypothetical protein